MKVLKITLWVLLCLIILLAGLMYGFMYKVKNGFPVTYETEHPNIPFPKAQKTILLFSKTTGFRHSESIEASKKVLAKLAEKQNWFLFETEKGGVFNADQLAKFNAVIFNNVTGRVLDDNQKKAFENYVENGGKFLGIHGAGDFSHHWPWYKSSLTGSEFSHHAIGAELQEALVLATSKNENILSDTMPQTWKNKDEWYVFYENPSKKGFEILNYINGETINPSGNIKFMVNDKNFGMGKQHPVTWCKNIGKGKSFYTSMGHDKNSWENPNFVKMLENELMWALK